MKRIQLFEFEDFHWFPNVIRTSITNLIVVFLKLMGTTRVLSSLIEKVYSKSHFDAIVDLGSGSGGAMPAAVEAFNQNNPKNVRLILSDLHPNPEIVERFNQPENALLEYHSDSLNAMNLEKAPKGLRTMVNSFHHMPPNVAKEILRSAQNSKQPFLAYELTENTIPLLAWWLFLPISLFILIVMSLIMTLFVRPLSFKQLFFTYLIPIVPLCYAWDGQASMVRTYTFDDIFSMLEEFQSEEYVWAVNPALNNKGKKAGYYIMGIPKAER